MIQNLMASMQVYQPEKLRKDFKNSFGLCFDKRESPLRHDPSPHVR